MRRVIFGLAFFVLFSCVPLRAEESKASAQTPVEAARQEKETLIANINGLRNQEMRVAVIQQLLNEEVIKLRNVQAAFCDTYKLDVDKFRRGLYRYDEVQGKFVLMENKPAADNK